MMYDKLKIVFVGEFLIFMGDIIVKVLMGECWKVLKCCDLKNVILFFDYEQRGLFILIVGSQDVVGVMIIKDIIGCFCFFFIVKLVQGVWFKVDSNWFMGIICLDWVYMDEVVFLCFLDCGMFCIIFVFIEILMKVLLVVNFLEILENQIIRDIFIKVNRMVVNYNNIIYFIFMVFEVVMVKNKFYKMVNMFLFKENVNGYS